MEQVERRAREVAYWMKTRELIRRRKEAGKPRPWTKDPILAAYRFCNVRREDDAVTRWIAANWRNPNAGDPGFVRAMTLARLINWPPTLAKIGYPHKWDPQRIVQIVQACEHKGKAWSSAYVVSTNGNRINKALYVVRDVATPLGNTPPPAAALSSLEAFYKYLRGYNGLGSFMAAQVVADVKNTMDHPLHNAPDWWDWAAPGPGSLRGLRFYFGGKLPKDFLGSMDIMVEEVGDLLPDDFPVICMQDWQNVMCEMSKWWRTKYGNSRPKAYYRPNPSFA